MKTKRKLFIDRYCRTFRVLEVLGRFATVASSSQIQEMYQDAIPVKTKQTTSWSTNVCRSGARGARVNQSPKKKEISHSARMLLL